MLLWLAYCTSLLHRALPCLNHSRLPVHSSMRLLPRTPTRRSMSSTSGMALFLSSVPRLLGAKMAVFAGETPSGEGAIAWEAAHTTFQRLNTADRYLFSVPMWNSGIPYILKQFIDVVSQPGMLFGFDPRARL